jgi:enoyl-CoA hydratase/carnithine racemase
MGATMIATRVDGAFLYVTLNRPEKRNAFTLEMVEQLSNAVCSADGIPGVRAVIVNAEGPVFSAGVDVFALAQARAEAADQNAGRWLRRMAEGLQHALHRIEATETPVIGVLHGKVLGLGLEVALSFDLRVAAASCTLGLPEARLGLVADVGGTTRLSRTVGPSRAKDLLMTAREMGADEALNWGLVNRVAPDAQVLETAIALANQIAANAPMAVGLGKRIIDQGDGLDKHTQMALERWAQGILITSEDFGEATQAFAERRPPEFRGA